MRRSRFHGHQVGSRDQGRINLNGTRARVKIGGRVGVLRSREPCWNDFTMNHEYSVDFGLSGCIAKHDICRVKVEYDRQNTKSNCIDGLDL